MKHNLGKVLLLYTFLMLSMLQAKDFVYQISINKSQPYVKEAVILTFDLNQTNPDVVMLFTFDLKKSPDYTFQRIDAKESDIHHNTKIRYTYLIYPLTSGDVPIDFTLIQKVTNDESVAYSYSGGRDNVKTLVTKDSTITLPPLVMHVKALPKGTELVGKFNLTQKAKKYKAQAYEPIPYQIQIKGVGYTPLLKEIFPKDLNITRFSEKPIVYTQHSQKGTESTIIYPFAFSHDQSFDLPPLVIHAFDPDTAQRYTLKTKKLHFEISKQDPKDLIDSSDNPPALKSDWSWLTSLLAYITVFAAGYLSAMTIKWKRSHTSTKESLLKEKIKRCKEEKALLQLLMATDSQHYRHEIALLEKSIYQNGRTSLSDIKQSALEKTL